MKEDEDRDYLFYVLPHSQPPQDHHPKIDDKPRSDGGLCWIENERLSRSDDENESLRSERSLNPPKLITEPASHRTLNIVANELIPFVVQPDPSSSTLIQWHIIYNPLAGRGLAKVWLDGLILPLLKFTGSSYEVHQSLPPDLNDFNHQNLYQSIFDQSTHPGLNQRVMILGGDGTTSDFLNQILRFDGQSLQLPSFQLILIPLGTANALFFSIHPKVKDLSKTRHVLTSLLLALFSSTETEDDHLSGSRPLPLSHLRILQPNSQVVCHQALAHVVASTALHASILHTADQLRNPIELNSGSNRFQQAFKLNQHRLWNAHLHLLPIHDLNLSNPSSSHPQRFRYDSHLQKWIDSGFLDDDLNLKDRFSYFTSCLIDRLESNFIIAPLRLDSDLSSMDVIMVRPSQDPTLKNLSDKDLAQASAAQVTEVMAGAYQSGSHLQLTNSDGQPVVEYWRCGGWIWTPVSDLKDPLMGEISP